METLATITGTLEQRVQSLLTMSPEQRKRLAARAVKDRDASALWSLLECHLPSVSRSGMAVSPNTLATYRHAVMDWLTWCADQGVGLLRPGDHAVRWLLHLQSQHSAKTVQLRLTAVRALYAALRWTGVTDARVFEGVKSRPDPTPAWDKREPYTLEELAAMLAAAGPIDRAIITLGAHSGLRASEIAALRWEQIDLGAHSVQVLLGKGGKNRTVPLSGSCMAALSEMGRPVGGGAVFGFGRRAVWERVKNAALRAGVRPRGAHSLRHAAGTELYRAGISLEQVARHLGHSDVSTTLVYAKLADKAARDVLSSW